MEETIRDMLTEVIDYKDEIIEELERKLREREEEIEFWKHRLHELGKI